MESSDLYGLPLERFTQERNALARQLRQAGRRDEAEAVAKLRKPSLAAWAVNQLVRTQRREVEALFDTGDELRKAQEDLMSQRGDSHDLRQAVEAERAAVEQLTDRARGLLSSEGNELTAPKLEHVSETLHAAALDQEARARVRDGCLDRELRHIGLGALVAAGGGRGPGRRRAAPTRAKQDQKAQAEARRRLERALREVKSAEQRHERAAESLREAEEALRSAQDGAARARQEVDQTARRP